MENDGNGMPPLHATELEAVHGPLEPTSDPQVAERVHQLYSFDIDHEMVGNTAKPLIRTYKSCIALSDLSINSYTSLVFLYASRNYCFAGKKCCVEHAM